VNVIPIATLQNMYELSCQIEKNLKNGHLTFVWIAGHGRLSENFGQGD
jgi:hypothetical protein